MYEIHTIGLSISIDFVTPNLTKMTLLSISLKLKQPATVNSVIFW